MKSLKISLLFCAAILGTIETQAQEISISANGGFQGLDYKVQNGDNKIKIGGKVGIGYTYFINKNWGILTGAELGYFNNHSSLKDNTYSSYEVDSDNEAFQFRVKTTGYKEKNQFYTASIPLMIQYRTAGDTQFYINGGGRVFFPFSGKTKANAGNITTTGYYADVNAEFENMPDHGFGTVSNWKNDSKLDLKTAWALSAETGVSFKLAEKLRLYTGVYVDYGLNNVQKNTQEGKEISIVKYNPYGIDQVEPNGIVNTTGIVDKAKLLAFGVQVKVGFGGYKAKDAEVIEDDNNVIEEVVVEEVVEEVIVVEAPKAEEKVVKTLDNAQIQFIEKAIPFQTLGNVNLSNANKTHLDEVAALLKEYPSEKVEIAGSTCSVDTAAKNLNVRTKRAKAVANYLETKGVNVNQLEVCSPTQFTPMYPNNTEANRSKNRQTTIKVVK